MSSTLSFNLKPVVECSDFCPVFEIICEGGIGRMSEYIESLLVIWGSWGIGLGGWMMAIGGGVGWKVSGFFSVVTIEFRQNWKISRSLSFRAIPNFYLSAIFWSISVISCSLGFGFSEAAGLFLS